MPFWIRKSKQIGLSWSDMNKWGNPQVSGAGGVIVILGFIIGLLSYIAYTVFILGGSQAKLVESLAVLSVVLLAGGLGFVDDLFGWRRGGLSIRSRLILLLFAAIPLVAINAGRSTIFVPFLGSIDFGIIYPLLIIPIGIVGATATFNFLEGFNGLGAGQGIILLSAMAVVAFFTGSSWLSVIALCMVGALVAFLQLNFSPAQVLPGDALTYAVGSLIASIAILGNFEKIAVFFFIPVIIETFLKMRKKLKVHSFAIPERDGTLKPRYDKLYGLTHTTLFIYQKLGIKPTERKVVIGIWSFQIVIVLLGLFIFREGIF